MTALTIKTDNEFKRVRRLGRRITGTIAAAIVLIKQTGRSRIGVIVSRKLCNAVKRNRIRRIFKEAFRYTEKDFSRPVDVIIYPKNGAIEGKMRLAKEFLDMVAASAG